MDSANKGKVGSKDEAIANARLLLRNGRYLEAVEQTREIVHGDEHCAEAYRLLGMALRKLGQIDDARVAETEAMELSSLQPDIFQATMALAESRPDKAEKLLRPYLQQHPDDAVALRLLAAVGANTGHFDQAERLVRQALAVAPEYPAALSLAEHIESSRRRSARPPGDAVRGGATLEPEDQYSEALGLYEKVVQKFPKSPENWVSYGHIQRTVGQQDKAVAAYRRAIQLKPSSGEAWWALADLKTRRLDAADIQHLERLVGDRQSNESDRIGMNFALGRALEQASEFERAFQRYAEGNLLRASTAKHDRNAVTRHVDESIALFGQQFFAERLGAGLEVADPIFVLGMPRSGSTLIEQILSSHAQIEGTMELPDIPAVAGWLAGGKNAGFEDSGYLKQLQALPGEELRRLGQGYDWGTRLRRQTQKPFFIDKMPNNWMHLGMILAILPNAKIIDARRNPMACGLSLFRQHFAKGQDFSYDLTDIGSLYVDYVRMMDHFDRTMPGRIIRVFHEDLVADPAKVIKSLLDRLKLSFDEHCLSFHENRRAVRTSSSEQVRRPINREGVDQWRSFEHWLGPLKDALGSIADCYPAVPATISR